MKALTDLIRDIPDFPEPGIMFKDITPLLADHNGLEIAVGALVDHYLESDATLVAGIESRGFIFATPMALRLGAGFIPIRKPGKLPYDVVREEYQLEYGTDSLEIHRDAVKPGDRVVIIDDVLATGGTAITAARLIEHLGATVVGIGVMVELGYLGGRQRLDGYELISLVQYEHP
ncbi:MAG: adenine phosphoribosyltransferase [Acidimicrobiia bacterium]|nr:adenine phosphoribosyltransferase [Acidimicrobiia bacterium]